MTTNQPTMSKTAVESKRLAEEIIEIERDTNEALRKKEQYESLLRDCNLRIENNKDLLTKKKAELRQLVDTNPNEMPAKRMQTPTPNTNVQSGNVNTFNSLRKFVGGVRGYIPGIQQAISSKITSAFAQGQEQKDFFSAPTLQRNPNLLQTLASLTWDADVVSEDIHIYGSFVGPFSIKEAPTKPSIDFPPPETFSSYIYCRTISSYPKKGSQREGDPICDRFQVQILDANRILFSLADGCSWGIRPHKAAVYANEGFHDYVLKKLSQKTGIESLANILLCAISAAHEKIITSVDDVLEAGTTTLVGGIIFRIRQKQNPLFEYIPAPKHEYAFMCASVGDCKVFRWSIKEKRVIEVTEGNRTNITSPTDPGGRIGPYNDEGAPDLSNLAAYFEYCDEGDFIIAVSDGVYDNLDPQGHGKTPVMLNVQAKDWTEASTKFPKEAAQAKVVYINALLEKHIHEAITYKKGAAAESVCERILNYCYKLTHSSREFLETNPGQRLPENYLMYPGKMDHTSCLVFQVQPTGVEVQTTTTTTPSPSLVNGEHNTKPLPPLPVSGNNNNVYTQPLSNTTPTGVLIPM